MSDGTPTSGESSRPKEEVNMTSEQIKCYLQQHREEIIQNGIENLPPEIRDAVLDELFGPEKTPQNDDSGNTGGI